MTTDSYLLEYRNEIKKGNIIAGRELILQLDNLIEDLDDPAYIYDTTDAGHRIEFIETFCKHTKSPYFGEPFILELWQKAFLEVFYSFKWTGEGYYSYYEEEPPQRHLRRFKKAIFLVARKNGKSTLASALLLTELMIGLPGGDFVCSSNDDAQARIIFEETGTMRELFDPSGKWTHKNLQYIFNKRAISKIFRLSDRTRNKEGRNIDGAVLDETHEMQDNIIAGAIELSQSTKDEPWLINITTEGFINDGYLDDELKYARQVLADDIEDPTLLSFLYTQDSENEIWQDEDTWQKSNPGLGTIKARRHIVDQMNKARHDTATRMTMLTKDFNWKQAIGEAWLLPEVIENDATFDMESLRGAVGLGSFDLADTTDLAVASMLIMLPGDNTKYVTSKYFIPETKVEEGSKGDRVNYLQWARQGLLEISPGNENNYSLITQWFGSLMRDYDIYPYKIGYDRWQAQYLVRELSEELHLKEECEHVNMHKKALSNPMKLIEADLRSKLINYNRNPITKWNLGNVALKIDNMGLIFPEKVQDQANRRIDGAISLILCYAMYQRHRTDYMTAIQRWKRRR